MVCAKMNRSLKFAHSRPKVIDSEMAAVCRLPDGVAGGAHAWPESDSEADVPEVFAVRAGQLRFIRPGDGDAGDRWLQP